MMMLQIMGYTVAVSATLGIAGLCLERFAALKRQPRRTAWMLAMCLSVLLPLTMVLTARQTDKGILPAASIADVDVIQAEPEGVAVAVPENPMTAASVPAMAYDVPQRPPWKFASPSDQQVLVLLAAVSSTFVLYLLGAGWVLRRRAVRWQRMTMLQRQVLVSRRTGPALFGVLQPRIVVPRWLIEESAATQELVLGHEEQHIAARDPLVIRVALLVLAAMPWNLPLWWQWRRLRHAIEIDCDARVMGAGAEPVQYGEVLLAVTQRATHLPPGTVGMSEPASALERRVRNLVPEAPRFASLQMITALVLAFAGTGLAIALEAPAIPGRRLEPGKNPAQFASSTDQDVIASRRSEGPALPQPAKAGVPGTVREHGAVPLLPPPPAPQVRRALQFDTVMQAAVARYPEIVQGPDSADTYGIAFVFRSDGTVYRSNMERFRMDGSDGAAVSRRLNDMLYSGLSKYGGSPRMQFFGRGTSMAGQGVLNAQLALAYEVLPADYDESRSLDRVYSAVLEKHSNLLLPRRGGVVNHVTVSMTEDGTIAREHVGQAVIAVPALPVRTPASAFEVLQLDSARIGISGTTMIARQPTGYMTPRHGEIDPEEQLLLVTYAWPLRDGEPAAGAPMTGAAQPYGTANAVAIVKRYCPSSFVNERESRKDGCWVILSREGKVIRAGQSALGRTSSFMGLPQQEAAATTLRRMVVTSVKDADGKFAHVTFGWQ